MSKQILIMRTTSNKVLAKKIDRLELKKNSLVYSWTISILTGETTFKPVFSQGSTWKHSSLIDKSIEFQAVLVSLGLNFNTYNDAPRGGKTGVTIKITTKIKL